MSTTHHVSTTFVNIEGCLVDKMFFSSNFLSRNYSFMDEYLKFTFLTFIHRVPVRVFHVRTTEPAGRFTKQMITIAPVKDSGLAKTVKSVSVL